MARFVNILGIHLTWLLQNQQELLRFWTCLANLMKLLLLVRRVLRASWFDIILSKSTFGIWRSLKFSFQIKINVAFFKNFFSDSENYAKRTPMVFQKWASISHIIWTNPKKHVVYSWHFKKEKNPRGPLSLLFLMSKYTSTSSSIICDTSQPIYWTLQKIKK